MTVYKVQNSDIIAPLFADSKKTFVLSYLQHYMGSGYVDNINNPQSAVIIVGGFYFYAGLLNREIVSYKPHNYLTNFAIMVPSNQQWANLIEQQYSHKSVKITRYAFRPNTNFDILKLQHIVSQLSESYQLKMIDRKLYDQILLTDWAKDLCANFKSYTEFETFGIGVVVLKDNIIVSGASSYIVYQEGIEVEIDTKEDERRNGLALICAAKLILECLSRNIYPNWDAHNQESRHLAEKLGYHFDKEYPAYVMLGV